jgi:hypothetical protein
MIRSLLTALIATFAAGLTLPIIATRPQAAMPDLVHYQGRLTDSQANPLSDNDYLVVFALYTDSLAGNRLWQEEATIHTQSGLFSHTLGSGVSLPPGLFAENDALFLELTVEGEAISPRTRLVSQPYALAAGALSVDWDPGSPAMRTTTDGQALIVYDSTGQVSARLEGNDGAGKLILADARGSRSIEMRTDLTGDACVVLPDSSIDDEELLNEPGIAASTHSIGVTLVTGVMTDLVTVDINIPTAGYIVLYGKCYLQLSGTTGSNTALIQIDENEGGGSQFPYFQQAGLAGYVNTETNYFPVFVTRIYYKDAGGYTFRLEGRANNQPPALAQSWDHVLTAVFYPTSYEGVKAIVSDPAGFADPVPITFDPDTAPLREGTGYEVDLRELERKARAHDKEVSGKP